MTIEDEVAVMRRIPLFAGIEPRKLKMLAAICRRVRFQPGEVLFRQGDDGDAAYVVIAGTAQVLARADPSDEESVIATVGRHGLIGELAIVCDIARTGSVRAESELDTLRIERDQFMLLLREAPEVAIAAMRTIGLRLADRTAEVARLKALIRSA